MWAWLLSLLPSDWLSPVWGIIPTAGIAKWWGSRQERLKREAVGSHLTDLEEEGSAGNLRWRYFELTLKTWTNTPLRILNSRIAWPPTAKAADKDELVRRATEDVFRKSGFLPIETNENFEEVVFEPTVRVSEFMKLLPAWMSRLTIVVMVETVDAQRRRLKFRIRSSEVDWGKR
jgi:hypothetical protein